jgi:hypothetical protein
MNMAREQPWSGHLPTLSSWRLPEYDMCVVLTLLGVGSLKSINTSESRFPFQDKLPLVIRQAPLPKSKSFSVPLALPQKVAPRSNLS